YLSDPLKKFYPIHVWHFYIYSNYIRIREIDKNIPVIMLTAYGEYSQDFTTWAADKYVVKSSDLTKIKNEIRNLLKEKEGE
ncbi:unnamed protein product, partial [marine sediment metagenome]